MAYNRMDDFSVAIDPRTGELRSAARGSLRRPASPGRAGINWRPLVVVVGLVVLVVVGVFAAALVSELM
jgi:hypothetical protein